MLYVPWERRPGIVVGTEDRTKEVEVSMAEGGYRGIQYSEKEDSGMINICGEDYEEFAVTLQNLLHSDSEAVQALVKRFGLDDLVESPKKSKSKKSKSKDDDDDDDDEEEEEEDDEDEKPKKK